MQGFDLHYQLVKEDYLDWIHWNVGRHSMKKMKIITAIIYAVFALVYLGSSIASKKDPISICSTVIVVALVGVFMFYIISPRHQERTIWKRSGLQKLERTSGFPRVNLSADDKGVTMEVPDQFCKRYSFTELTEWEETERLYLMGTTEKTWQFIAKSAFDGEENGEAFKIFMTERIADARENPEKYRVEEETPVEAAEREDDREDSSWGGAEDADEVVIQHVDTSNMGKIGQMAHLMAALASDDEPEHAETDFTEATSSEDKTGEEL